MLRSLLAFTVLALPLLARADGLELQTSLRPTFSVLQRANTTNYGFGGGVRVAYSPIPRLDFLAIEAGFSCSQFMAIKEDGASHKGRTGALVYDSTRCAIGPAVALRYGAQFIVSLALGFDFLYEHQTRRDFVSEGILLDQLSNDGLTSLAPTARAGFEYRIVDLFSLGAESGLRRIPTAAELDLTFGLTLSLFLYP